MGDVHIPYHDRNTVEQAVKFAKKQKAVGILLNGDILDAHHLSRFVKCPKDPTYSEEIKRGRQFLKYLRDRFPKATIIFRDGNHDERLYTYLMTKAPELYDLDVLTMEALLQFQEHGIEHVTDRRVVRIGHLNTIHGHEYPFSNNPVNPARGLFLRAKSVAICSHFHQSSEHHEKNITGKPEAAWSIGCCCQLTPYYFPLNKWNHGFAMVKLAENQDFEVLNKRLLGGEVV